MTSKPQRSSVFGAMLVLFVACFFVESVWDGLRYLKYGLPLIAVLMAAPVDISISATHAGEYRQWFRSALLTVLGVLVAGFLATIWRGPADMRFFEESYFILAPLLLGYLALPHLEAHRIDRYARFLAIGVTLSFVAEVNTALLRALHGPSDFLAQFVSSNSAAESGTSFVFGLFCLYFLFSEKRRAALAMAVLLVLSFKRVAIGGTAVIAVTYWVLKRARIDLGRYRRFVPVVMLAVNGLILLLIYELAHGAFDEVISRYTGLPANFLTMGRTHYYSVILSRGGITWTGHGLGFATMVLQSEGYRVLNAHSDILKYAVELGPPLAGLLIFQFYRLCSRTTETVLLLGYLNVLFVSDNVSIYFEVMFLFYVLHGFLVARSPQTGSASSPAAPTR